jgi:CRP/FNR family transcriptional regulator, cyclic AMP receptor protein
MPDLLALSTQLPEREVATGEAIIVEGQRAPTLFIVVDGAFEVRHGDVVLASVDAPGSCLGELSVLLDQAPHATVVATRPSRVRVADDAVAFLHSDARVALVVATILAYRLDVVNGYLADIKAQYAETPGHLGVIHEVLADLASSKPQKLEFGSEREPEPRY